MSFKILAERFIETRDKLAVAKATCADLQKTHDYVRFVEIPDAMVEAEVTSINIKGVGRLGISGDLRVSVLSEDKMALHEWMRGNGHEDMVSDTINSSTLKAWVKQMQNEGNEVPEDLIQILPYLRASVTKS